MVSCYEVGENTFISKGTHAFPPSVIVQLLPVGVADINKS
jgi:hypothetical protein